MENFVGTWVKAHIAGAAAFASAAGAATLVCTGLVSAESSTLR